MVIFAVLLDITHTHTHTDTHRLTSTLIQVTSTSHLNYCYPTVILLLPLPLVDYSQLTRQTNTFKVKLASPLPLPKTFSRLPMPFTVKAQVLAKGQTLVACISLTYLNDLITCHSSAGLFHTSYAALLAVALYTPITTHLAEFQFCQDEKNSGMDSGYGCTTRRMHLTSLNCRLKNG